MISALMVERLKQIAAAGKSYTEAATETGLSYPSVFRYARRFEINFRPEKRGRRPKEGGAARSENMARMYREGKTLQQIGARYLIGCERVRQILTGDHGIHGKDGGKAEQGRRNRKERQRKREARSLQKWGCSYEDYTALRLMRGPTRAYQYHERNAIKRGIRWEFNLWQWWTIWKESGRWEQRGCGQGRYVMCRKGDVGPYAPGNVYIALSTHNNSVRPQKKTTLPIGVAKKKNRFVAQRMIGGKIHWLGSFPTAELAALAYHDAFPSEPLTSFHTNSNHQKQTGEYQHSSSDAFMSSHGRAA